MYPVIYGILKPLPSVSLFPGTEISRFLNSGLTAVKCGEYNQRRLKSLIDARLLETRGVAVFFVGMMVVGLLFNQCSEQN